MGLFDGLKRMLRGDPILSCKITLTAMTDGAAKYHEERPHVDGSEYARFILHFYAKMLFNYCTDPNMSGGIASLRKSIQQLTLAKHGLEPAVGIVLMMNHAAALESVGNVDTGTREFTGTLLGHSDPRIRSISTGVPYSIYPTDPSIATLVAIRGAAPLAGPRGCDIMLRGLSMMESRIDSGTDISASKTMFYLPIAAFMEATGQQ